jgi:hypothetical protein
MKTIGLLYPISGKTERRREELLESGRVFFHWLDNVGDVLGWKVYDYHDNNDEEPPDTSVACLVVFGKVSKARVPRYRPRLANLAVPIFRAEDYEDNLDLVKDIFITLGRNDATV